MEEMREGRRTEMGRGGGHKEGMEYKRGRIEEHIIFMFYPFNIYYSFILFYQTNTNI